MTLLYPEIEMWLVDEFIDFIENKEEYDDTTALTPADYSTIETEFRNLIMSKIDRYLSDVLKDEIMQNVVSTKDVSESYKKRKSLKEAKEPIENEYELYDALEIGISDAVQEVLDMFDCGDTTWNDVSGYISQCADDITAEILSSVGFWNEDE